MTEPPHKAALAYACTHLNELRENLASLPAERRLTPPSTLVDGLLGAFTGTGPYESWLDEIDEALRRGGDALGLYGLVGQGYGFRGLTPSGVESPPPSEDEIVYLCPVERCTRYAFAEDGTPPPCALTGRPLREDRL